MGERHCSKGQRDGKHAQGLCHQALLQATSKCWTRPVQFRDRIHLPQALCVDCSSTILAEAVGGPALQEALQLESVKGLCPNCSLLHDAWACKERQMRLSRHFHSSQAKYPHTSAGYAHMYSLEVLVERRQPQPMGEERWNAMPADQHHMQRCPWPRSCPCQYHTLAHAPRTAHHSHVPVGRSAPGSAAAHQQGQATGRRLEVAPPCCASISLPTLAYSLPTTDCFGMNDDSRCPRELSQTPQLLGTVGVTRLPLQCPVADA